MADEADTIPSRAVIAGAEPQLFVADIKASCEFFTGKLGFAVAFTYGEPPFYAQVRRDGARINLRCVERPVIDAGQRDREQLLSASLTVATSRGDQGAFPRSSGRRRDIRSNSQAQALGRAGFYYQRPGWQSAAVRRTGRVAGLRRLLRLRCAGCHGLAQAVPAQAILAITGIGSRAVSSAHQHGPARLQVNSVPQRGTGEAAGGRIF